MSWFFEEEVLEPGQSMDAWVQDFGNTIERTQDAFERRKEMNFSKNRDEEHGDYTNFDFERPMKSLYFYFNTQILKSSSSFLKRNLNDYFLWKINDNN